MEVASYDYEYRTNTEVITSVRIKGGQSDPEHPVTVTFQIGGRDYRVENVYYPEGEEQLAWVRWTTPKEEQVMEIPVTVEGGGTAEKGIITARITELGKDPLRTRMRTIETIAFRLCRYLIGVKQQRQDGVCGSRGGRQNGSGMRHRRQRKRDIGLTKAGGSFCWNVILPA